MDKSSVARFLWTTVYMNSGRQANTEKK